MHYKWIYWSAKTWMAHFKGEKSKCMACSLLLKGRGPYMLLFAAEREVLLWGSSGGVKCGSMRAPLTQCIWRLQGKSLRLCAACAPTVLCWVPLHLFLSSVSQGCQRWKCGSTRTEAAQAHGASPGEGRRSGNSAPWHSWMPLHRRCGGAVGFQSPFNPSLCRAPLTLTMLYRHRKGVWV